MSNQTAIHQEVGKIYLMAVCPRYRAISLVLETRADLVEPSLAWWRCYLCLAWHRVLVPA